MEHVLYREERVACLIDGSNLNHATTKLQFSVDFMKLRRYFTARCRLMQCVYFTAIHTEQDGQVRIQQLVDWLKYNGFILVSKPTKSYTDTVGNIKTKGNLDVEITVRAMELIGKIDHLYLFSGDGDFTFLVDTLQRNGIRVTVVSSRNTAPSTIADELRSQADIFIELTEWEDIHYTKPE